MQNLFRTSCLSLLVLASLSACSDPKPTKPVPPAATPAVPAVNPHLIREGIGVGGVELGMTEGEVRARLGTPASENRSGDRLVFLSYHTTEIFGLYFDEATGRLRMIIASMRDKTWCTDFDVCLYREGDLAKLIAHHGKNLVRYVDRDGSVTLRMLVERGTERIMTEYTPVESHQGIVQVAILYWTGKIDTSSFD